MSEHYIDIYLNAEFVAELMRLARITLEIGGNSMDLIIPPIHGVKPPKVRITILD